MMRFLLLPALAIIPFFTCAFITSDTTEVQQQADHFLQRTLYRINDAWFLCRHEFKLAFFGDDTHESALHSDVRDAARSATVQAVDQTRDFVTNTVSTARSGVEQGIQAGVRQGLDNAIPSAVSPESKDAVTPDSQPVPAP